MNGLIPPILPPDAPAGAMPGFAQGNASALAQRFEALMANAALSSQPATTHAPVVPLEMPGMISALSKASQAVAADMQHFDANVSAMSAEQLHATSSRMVLDAAMVTASTTLTSAVMQGGKSSLQTLMKNQ